MFIGVLHFGIRKWGGGGGGQRCRLTCMSVSLALMHFGMPGWRGVGWRYRLTCMSIHWR